ncbi:hypothetical protein [Deinococcus aestuarii]|uniref:hypothetical protein n=1 Tax=Deinococcus aestuarii TaxID=2774531 RepID=UPI001C0CC8E8|nr:hypothetical protein [Deinococcus aestuarii]
MRKAILTGLLAGLCAASAGSVKSSMDARVENLCVFQANGADVNPATSSVTGASIDLGTYRANRASASATTVVARVQCNRGTRFIAAPLPSPLALNRQGGGGAPLLTRVLAGAEAVDDNGRGPGRPGNDNDPDVYLVNVRVEADAGQWGVMGGQYRGTATIIVRYD